MTEQNGVERSSATKELRRLLDELRDENARLRDELDAVGTAAYLHGRDQLKAENAKLRELARHLRECTRHNVCAVCEYADDACDFDHDMRELGIEVDG